MKRLIAALLLALWPLAAGAQVQEFTPPQMRGLAVQALRAGDIPAALDFAHALLQRDGFDAVALYVQAEALLLLGQYQPAARSAAEAFRQAPHGPLRFDAGRVAALANARAERLTAAQYWLRRALPEAPDLEARQAVIRDFQAVRSQNPLSLSGSFGLSPMANVNGGSPADVIYIAGLPFPFLPSPDAQPLSGLQVSAGVTLGYRIAGSQTSITQASVQLTGLTYLLSPEAKEATDGYSQTDGTAVTGADYAETTLTFGLNHAFKPETGPERLSFSLQAGRKWYGGEVLRDFARLGGEARYALDSGAGLTLAAQAEWNSEPGTADYAIYTAQSRLALPRSEAGQWSLGLGLTRNTSDDSDTGYRSAMFSADYALARPIADMRLSIGAGYELRAYDSTGYWNPPDDQGYFRPVDRTDRIVDLGLTLAIPRGEVWGFTPSLSLGASHTFSTVEFFERDAVTMGLTWQSSF